MSRNKSKLKKDFEFGKTSAKPLMKVAKATQESDTFPLIVSTSKLSRTQLLKNYALNLIKFCLKSDITDNIHILKFLKENGVNLKGRTFGRYKSIAKRELENDIDSEIWLSQKIQNVLIHDFRDIYDRYERQLLQDDFLLEALIMRAKNEALQKHSNIKKFYEYLDIYTIIRVQEASNQTMENKLKLMSNGMFLYKIKRHIEDLQASNRKLRDQQWNKDKEKQHGFVLAPHLQEIEKKLGKRISTLEDRVE